MCFNAPVSLITFIIGILGSIRLYLLDKNQRVFSLLGYVLCSLLNSFYGAIKLVMTLIKNLHMLE